MREDHQRRALSTKLSNYLPNSRVIPALVVTFALGYFTASLFIKTTITPSDHTRFDMIDQCADSVAPQNVRSTILDSFYDGVSPYENFPTDCIKDLLKPTRLEGWGSNDVVFRDLIKKVRPKTIIEVGTFLGASATFMANVSRELGLSTQILCVDDFRGWAGFRDMFKGFPIQNANVMLLSQFMQNVVTLDFTDNILPLPFSSSSTLDRLCQLGIVGDLIEIDAAHDFHSAWEDINRAYKLLRPGGIMFGHDYFNGQDDYGVRRAVDMFAKIHGFKIKTTHEHWILDL